MDEKDTSEKKSIFLVPASIVAAGAIIAVAVIYTGGVRAVRAPADSSPNSGNQAAAVAGGTRAAAEDGDPFLGNPDAPVTMIEFSDFQCPFCGKFFREVEARIIEKYVKSGKLRFVYRDFAFLGPESEWAGVAAECANEQGKFWQYHDYIFKNQQGENQGAFSKDNLKRFSRELGLDASKFNSCLDTDKYLDEVKKDSSDGRASGVTGTPGFLINGKLVVGALPYEQFESAIEAALAGK